MGCCCATLKEGEEILATEEFIMDCSPEQAIEYIPNNCNWSGFDKNYMKTGILKDEWTGEWPNGEIHHLMHYAKFKLDQTWKVDIENKHYFIWYVPPPQIAKHVEKFEQNMWFFAVDGQPEKCRFKV